MGESCPLNFTSAAISTLENSSTEAEWLADTDSICVFALVLTCCATSAFVLFETDADMFCAKVLRHDFQFVHKRLADEVKVFVQSDIDPCLIRVCQENALGCSRVKCQ